MLPMQMEIRYGTRFRRQYQKADKKIKAAFSQTLEVFIEDPNHATLRNHALKEKFAGYRSIDITGDYRAVFKEIKAGKQRMITFYMIGTHKDLYRS